MCPSFKSSLFLKLATVSTMLTVSVAKSCRDSLTGPEPRCRCGYFGRKQFIIQKEHYHTLNHIVTRIVRSCCLVRRELEGMTPTSFPHDAQNTYPVTVPLIQAVVREELLNLGVQPVCSVNHPCLRYGPPASPPRRDNMPPRF